MKLKAIIFISLCLALAGCTNREQPIEKSTESPPSSEKQQEKIQDPLYFLVIGIDSRGEELSRTDSIIVVKYTPEDRSVKLVSVMRDSFVEIPNYEKKYHKINTAYFLGKEVLLKETLDKNFNLGIDHTITIDFKGFAKVIDTLIPEGISVEVSKDMIDNMNLQMDPGKHALHGDELLKYVRFRKDKRSDFGRVDRQQEVLLSVMKAMQEKLNSFDGLTKTPQLVEEVIKYIHTDLSPQEILSLAATILTNPIEKMETMRIPVQEGYTNGTSPYAGAILELDLEKNNEVLKEFFSKSKPVVDQEKDKGK